MKHTFDVKIAQAYGLESGVMMENIHFWMLKNRENKRNYHDGRYWTYNSLKAWSEVFPYWTVDQIHRIVNKLVDEGLVLIGNYNRHSFDRTNWYSLTEKALELLDSSILDRGEMEGAKSQKAFGRKPMTIPDINPDIGRDTGGTRLESQARFYGEGVGKHWERGEGYEENNGQDGDRSFRERYGIGISL